MRTRIETHRLILRPFEPADTEAAFGWFGDPVVMRFTVTGPDKSIERTRTRLTFFENHQLEHGFSKWVILNGASGVAIGDSGCSYCQNAGGLTLVSASHSRIGGRVWPRRQRQRGYVWPSMNITSIGWGHLSILKTSPRFEFWKNWGFMPNGGTRSWAWSQSCFRSTQIVLESRRQTTLVL
jgi:hypothetical protein